MKIQTATLARIKGQFFAKKGSVVTYCNKTQAQKSADKINASGEFKATVIQPGLSVCFYVLCEEVQPVAEVAAPVELTPSAKLVLSNLYKAHKAGQASAMDIMKGFCQQTGLDLQAVISDFEQKEAALIDKMKDAIKMTSEQWYAKHKNIGDYLEYRDQAIIEGLHLSIA